MLSKGTELRGEMQYSYCLGAAGEASSAASTHRSRVTRRLHGASGNRLLDALADAQYRKLEPHLELVPLPVGRVLAASNDRLTHVYFPTTGIVSLLMPLKGELREEVAVTGNEGVIGISAFLEGSGAATPRRAIVQHAGQAWRLPADLLAEQFDSDGEFQRLLLRYTQALITQIAQTVVCNRYHRITEQLCRWMLLRLDRLPSCELRATQQRIANLLGVRREGITAAVAELRRADLVRFTRGRVTVLDRRGLEQNVCECYAVINKEYARLLAHERPRQWSQK
jgi:CRP-like cAMP-binding protein